MAILRWIRTMVTFLAICELTQSQQCGNAVDLIFVVGQPIGNDDSSRIWYTIKQFLIDVISGLTINSTHTRIGVVTYSTKASLSISLGKMSAFDTLQDAILALPLNGSGANNIYAGLYTMRKSAYNATSTSTRPAAMKIVVLITDRPADVDAVLVQQEASTAFNEGIRIFTIGITSLVNEDQLKMISIPPHTRDVNYFIIPDYDLVSDLVQTIQKTVCNPPKPTLPGCGMVDLTFMFGWPPREEQWTLIHTYIQNFVTAYATIGPDAIQISVVSFGVEQVDPLIPFSSSTSEQSFLNDFNNIIDKIGTLELDDADSALKWLLKSNNGRVGSHVSKVVVVIVDSHTKNIYTEAADARLLRGRGVRFLVVDVSEGSDTIQDDQAIADNLSDVTVSTYDFLPTTINGLANRLCNPKPILDTICPVTADVVLVLDMSDAVLVPDYHIWPENVLGFAVSIVNSLPIAPNMTQVGLVTFSNFVVDSFQLNNFTDGNTTTHYIQNIPIQGGKVGKQRDIAAALRETRLNQFSPDNGARPGFRKIVFLFADGDADLEINQTLNEANLLKKDGIEVFVIGVTEATNDQQLMDIASSSAHYFQVTDNEHLSTIFDALLDVACRNISVLPTIPPPSKPSLSISSPATTANDTTESTLTPFSSSRTSGLTSLSTTASIVTSTLTITSIPPTTTSQKELVTSFPTVTGSSAAVKTEAPRPPSTTPRTSITTSTKPAFMTTVVDDTFQSTTIASSNTRILVGAVVGTILGIFALLAVAAIIYYKRRNRYPYKFALTDDLGNTIQNPAYQQFYDEDDETEAEY